jgi:DNA-binding response OmpR family regulator
MKILLIEDDREIANFLKRSLQEEFFIVDVARDGERGLSMARINNYDLILLDYILPKKDGREICKEIRISKDTPIIMLSVRSEISDKSELLDLGVDDYVTKPFSFEELLSRVRAVLRRPKKIEKDVLRTGNLWLDYGKHIAMFGNRDLELTRKEFILLEFFMKNKGQTISRSDIIEHVWDSSADPFSNTIETHIASLRRKIDSENKLKYIKTVSGSGYRLD